MGLRGPREFTIAQVPDGPPRVTRVGRHFTGDRESVRHAAEVLARADAPMIVAGDGVGAADAWEELDRLAARIGTPVYIESLSSYMNFPNHSDRWQGTLPTSQAGMQDIFASYDAAFLCGFNSQAPVLVYRYSDGPLIPAHVSQVYLHDDEWEIGKNGYGEAAILGDIKATLPLLSEEVATHPALDRARVTAREAELSRLAGQRRGQLVDVPQTQHPRALRDHQQPRLPDAAAWPGGDRRGLQLVPFRGPVVPGTARAEGELRGSGGAVRGLRYVRNLPRRAGGPAARRAEARGGRSSLRRRRPGRARGIGCAAYQHRNGQ
jgi:thiamine pyrophosphate-dependent acetolactate synthase large subunit-like protein